MNEISSDDSSSSGAYSDIILAYGSSTDCESPGLSNLTFDYTPPAGQLLPYTADHAYLAGMRSPWGGLVPIDEVPEILYAQCKTPVSQNSTWSLHGPKAKSKSMDDLYSKLGGRKKKRRNSTVGLVASRSMEFIPQEYENVILPHYATLARRHNQVNDVCLAPAFYQAGYSTLPKQRPLSSPRSAITTPLSAPIAYHTTPLNTLRPELAPQAYEHHRLQNSSTPNFVGHPMVHPIDRASSRADTYTPHSMHGDNYIYAPVQPDTNIYAPVQVRPEGPSPHNQAHAEGPQHTQYITTPHSEGYPIHKPDMLTMRGPGAKLWGQKYQLNLDAPYETMRLHNQTEDEVAL